MQDDHKLDSAVFIKGFNEGYIIAQHMPELAESLAKVQADSERLNGLKAGQRQYQKEQIEYVRTQVPHEPTKYELPSWLKSDRSTTSRNSPDKSKGRDIEPDQD